MALNWFASTEPGRPLRHMAAVTAPLLVTSLAQIGLTLVDTALMGRVSTSALAALGISAPVYVVAVMVVRGWATGARTLVAQRFGAGRLDDVRGVLAVAVLAAVAIGCTVAAALALTARVLVGTLTEDQSLIEAGALYLQLAALALPFLAGTVMVEATYAGLGQTRAIMLMAVVVLGVKVPSGAALIFAGDWGIAGAALSTVLGTVAGCGFLVWWGWRRMPEVVGFSMADVRSYWGQVAPKLWTIGWPETTSLVLAFVSTVVVIGFVASLGNVDVAAFRIVSGVLSMLFAVTFACSNGVAILVGQRLGAGQPAAAHRYQHSGLQLAAMLAAAVSLPLLIVPSVVLGAFSPDTEVVDLAIAAAWPALAAVPIMVVAMNLAGVLRAAGDTRSTMVALLISSYLVEIPLAWLLHDSHGVLGVCLAVLAAWTARLVVTWYRYRSGAWRTGVRLLQ